MREAGILLPIASLPSNYGIGAFSKEAYEFIDLLKEAGQSYWQILPLGPTGYGDSPYQSFSAFAGNPYFIDLEKLTEQGLLTKEECGQADFGEDCRYIDYEKLYMGRSALLRKAWERYQERNRHLGSQGLQEKLEAGLRDETKEYCFYAAVKKHFQEACWIWWEEGIKLRKPEAMEHYRNLLEEEILFYEFQQMLF